MKTNNYIGITYKFGLELFYLFIKSRNIDMYNRKNNALITKIQYVISGFIADNWNIDKELGSGSICYFGRFCPIYKYDNNKNIIPLSKYMNAPLFYNKNTCIYINKERYQYWISALSVIIHLEKN